MAKIQWGNITSLEHMVIRHTSHDPYSPFTIVLGENRITFDLNEQQIISAILATRAFKRKEVMKNEVSP
jgi:hypothetical protein